MSHPPHRLQEAAERLLSLKVELRAARQHFRSALLRHRTQEQLPAGVSLSAKVQLCRLAVDEARVRAFLAARMQRPVGAIHRRVADLLAWYSSKNEAERVHDAGPSAAPAAVRAGAVVDKYLQENNLHEWVTIQNLLKGNTPTTLVVLHRLAGAEPSAAYAFGGSAPSKKAAQFIAVLETMAGMLGFDLVTSANSTTYSSERCRTRRSRMGSENAKNGAPLGVRRRASLKKGVPPGGTTFRPAYRL